MLFNVLAIFFWPRSFTKHLNKYWFFSKTDARFSLVQLMVLEATTLFKRLALFRICWIKMQLQIEIRM